MFVAALTVILAAVIAYLSHPLWRTPAVSQPVEHEASKDQERVDLETERETLLAFLRDLELDMIAGRMTPPDYERLKAGDERRLVQVLAKIDELDRLPKTKRREPPPQESSRTQRWGVSTVAIPAVVGVLVVGSATGIYSYIQGKERAEKAAADTRAQGAQGMQGMPNPLEMVARLEKRLKDNPNDLQGQTMLGRSYMTLQRLPDARTAWSKVVELDPKNPEAHTNLGLILLSMPTNNRDQRIFEEVLSHFDIALMKVPDEPVVLWYKGVALFHLNRFREVDESWTKSFQGLAPGSEDAEYVKGALTKLRAGKNPFS